MRVCRTHEQARATYDKVSRFYGLISGPFENRFKELTLKELNAEEGDIFLISTVMGKLVVN